MPKRLRTDSELVDSDPTNQRPVKQRKMGSAALVGPYTPRTETSWVPGQRETHKIVKLAPTKPFDSVPPGFSATGPRRSQKLNHFLISRAVVLESHKKTLHLSAMGAAIPLLIQLTASLPHALPFDRSKIEIQIKTGTARVNDELVPNDEDEDISLRTRDKSALHVVVRIDGGDPELPAEAAKQRRIKKRQKDEDQAASDEDEDAIEE
ncbi:hypothetical protein BKA62DRAFT_683094 [Auriculariales sp. MPI-PUGE-AT-0066]|nr:hypothetical protein BKA62DRAFT_683094 [Auriculariales sp. MPI-PUGE-AT-0066]